MIAINRRSHKRLDISVFIFVANFYTLLNKRREKAALMRFITNLDLGYLLSF
jgi:hypothetical protein